VPAAFSLLLSQVMNNEQRESDANRNSNGPSASRADPGDHVSRNAFVRRARAAAAGLPARIDEQMRRSPYIVLGVVGVLGAGVGVILSSRILRALVTATATAVALELTRGFIRKNAWVDVS
jgi:hypothetical protein